jgi:hypothetical protein
MNEAAILGELQGGLWHTTHPSRFQQILLQKAIVPEPNIPDEDRWCTASGPKNYPYVRTLGGVSLFDFKNFDPVSYAERCPLSTWYEFVPFRKLWQCAVWIEIDRLLAAANLISGTDLLARWKHDAAYGHMIMPFIEAAISAIFPSRRSDEHLSFERTKMLLNPSN